MAFKYRAFIFALFLGLSLMHAPLYAQQSIEQESLPAFNNTGMQPIIGGEVEGDALDPNAKPEALPLEQGEGALEELPPIDTSMIDKPVVRLRLLDKITALTETFSLKIDETHTYKTLTIRPRDCKRNPDIVDPESASFLEIWENAHGASAPEWVFSGWMFSSSPALSAMDHAQYDVWVLACLDEMPKKEMSQSE